MNAHRYAARSPGAIIRVKLVGVLSAHVALCAAASLAQAGMSQQLEQLLIAENWPEASKLLENVSGDWDKNPDPVLRLVRGHVLLARNRNNKSACLLLSVTSPKDLAECQRWSESLVAKHPKKPIAYYFQGDVQARLGDFVGAAQTFSKGLKLNEKHALLNNAKGVACASGKQLALARVHFDMAVKNPDVQLADAYANLGMFRIQKKDGAKAAMDAFDRALQISPDFAFALHGRGCVALIMNRKAEAEKDLTRARQTGTYATQILTADLVNAFMGLPGVHAKDRETLRATLQKEGVGAYMKQDLANFYNSWANGQKNGLETKVFLDDWYHRASLLGADQGLGVQQYFTDFYERNSQFRDMVTTPTAQLYFSTAEHSYLDVTMNILQSSATGVNLSDLTQARQMEHDFIRGIGAFDGGGVFASFKHSVFDDTEWPFTPLYGLVYDPNPVKPTAVSKRTKEAK